MPSIYPNLVLFRTPFNFVRCRPYHTKIERTNKLQQRDFHTRVSYRLRCEFIYCSLLLPSILGSFSQPSSSFLASVLASLLLRECRCPCLYNNSVAISLVTGLSVTCEVFRLLLLQPTTLLGTHGNLASNTPFHHRYYIYGFTYRRSVSVALHTCVRRFSYAGELGAPSTIITYEIFSTRTKYGI